MRIGVISDTHVPVRARALPGEVFRIFAGVDLILHAGDLVALDVLEELQATAPVLAVRGNVDHPEVQERLPAALRIEVGPSGVVKVESKGIAGGRSGSGGEGGLGGGSGWRPLLMSPGSSGAESHGAGLVLQLMHSGPRIVIGLVHGHEGKGQTTAERAASNFPDASVVVFGHTHQPMNEWHHGRLFFNPGSATDPRRAPSATVGIIEVSETVRSHLIGLKGE
ncbi:MAG: metallophosphoesterase family protein [Limnochordales bacterium]|nr:metallophosphoesterase family protein [Limnochordales bacterium]